MISVTRCISSLLLLTFLVSSMHASPGQLDPSFGVGGIARHHFARTSRDESLASALQPDGKIIVAGFDSSIDLTLEPTKLLISRINADGTLDTSFGTGGITTKLFVNPASATALVLQTDGKIVVGGSITVPDPGTNSSARRFLVTRFNSNGSVDNSFGTNGSVETPFNQAEAVLTSLALQPDGKIVAGGYSAVQGSAVAMAAVRYTTNGTPDSSFDGDGIAFASITGLGNRANDVEIQADGKIVLGGTARRESSSLQDFAVIRLTTNGTPDNSFDSDGKVLTVIGATSSSSIFGMKIQPDGKIVAVGNSVIGAARDVVVARYNSDGQPDNAFDADGFVVTDVGTDFVNGVDLQSDGKIIVCGRSIMAADPPAKLLSLRFTSSGTLDGTYNGTGIVTTRIVDGEASNAAAVLVQPDGKILLTGSNSTFFDSDFALTRYDSGGMLDPSFDSDGKVSLEFGNSPEHGGKIAFQSDGKIVAVGDSYNEGFMDATIERFNANGTIDSSFGNLGSVAQHFTAGNSFISDVEVQADDKIVVAVNVHEDQKYYILRYLPNGQLDSMFGTGGIATIPTGSAGGFARDLIILPDGKIIAAGSSLNPTPVNSAIRLKADGTLDEDFGSSGKLFIPDAGISQVIQSIAMGPDGKIYAAAGNGSMTNPGSSQFAVMRFTQGGVLDATFGGGVVHTTFTSQGDAYALAVQPDGKVVVGGMGWEGYPLARYNTNGTLDETFDGDGKMVVPVQVGAFGHVRGIVIQPNGKIALAGGNVPNGGDTDATLFRHNADGSLDNTFGPGGKIALAMSPVPDSFSSLRIKPDGKILAIGTSSNGLNYDFTLAQFLADTKGTPFDFDGDGKTDVGIFRPSVGEWWIYRSATGSVFAAQFGASTDEIAPADYTGDGKTDIAFFRPSTGEWFVVRSEDNTYYSGPFGAAGDIPVPADYDADGKADVAVFRPSSGFWFISRSTGGTTTVPFGANGDHPVAADYDGDGKTDIAIYRPSVGEWWLNRTTAGVIAYQFGNAADKNVPGDYTGDGKADVAFWRPATGEWFILRSENTGYYSAPFGTAGDIVAPGDYDGDGKFDLTVFRPSVGTWFVNRTTGGTTAQGFGTNGDRPLANAYVP